MLGVFHKTVVKSPVPPSETESFSVLKDGLLTCHFTFAYPHSVIINLAFSGYMAYSTHTQSDPLLRSQFAAVDDIFCLFKGHIENVARLKELYGMEKTPNEALIVIEDYRTFRGKGPDPAEQVVRNIQGNFAFILFDITSKAVFIASDADESIPFFCGSDVEGHLVVSDDSEVVKQDSAKSASFPKGCFFTTSNGLQFIPKVVPRVDGEKDVCSLAIGL